MAKPLPPLVETLIFTDIDQRYHDVHLDVEEDETIGDVEERIDESLKLDSNMFTYLLDDSTNYFLNDERFFDHFQEKIFVSFEIKVF